MRALTVEQETYRQQIEDPLLLYDAKTDALGTERLQLRHAIDGTHGGVLPPGCHEILLSDDDDPSPRQDSGLRKAERKAVKLRYKLLKKQLKKEKKEKKHKKKKKRQSSSSSSSSSNSSSNGGSPVRHRQATLVRERDMGRDRGSGRERSRDRVRRETKAGTGIGTEPGTHSERGARIGVVGRETQAGTGIGAETGTGREKGAGIGVGREAQAGTGTGAAEATRRQARETGTPTGREGKTKALPGVGTVTVPTPSSSPSHRQTLRSRNSCSLQPFSCSSASDCSSDSSSSSTGMGLSDGSAPGVQPVRPPGINSVSSLSCLRPKIITKNY